MRNAFQHSTNFAMLVSLSRYGEEEPNVEITRSRINLKGMRRDLADMQQAGDYQPRQLTKLRTECVRLWGAIECLKDGHTPILWGSARYLQQ
jgi:hypothetical protein